MTNRRRVPHITGLNTSQEDTFGGPGSHYRCDGSPGALAGFAEGFSLAFGIYVPAVYSDTYNVGVQSTPFVGVEPGLGPPLNRSHITVETLAWNRPPNSNPGNMGWQISTAPDAYSPVFGNLGITIPKVNPAQRHDDICLVTFVPDDAPYGGIGDSRLNAYVNGQLVFSSVTPLTYLESAADFFLGAYPPSGPLPQTLGGMFNSRLNSLWVTPGIPTVQDVNAFFRRSMQDGYVVPQPWAPAIEQLGEQRVVPDAPTGVYFNAADARPDLGLGSTWTDRISGVVLTLEGVDDGNARIETRQPWYWASDFSAEY